MYYFADKSSKHVLWKHFLKGRAKLKTKCKECGQTLLMNSIQILPKMSWNLKFMMLFHANSTKNVMKSQNHDFIPYNFYQKCREIPKSRHYSVQILPKNVMKSHNHDVIPYKFYEDRHEISQSWRYSIQILQKMSRNPKIKTLFRTYSSKNVMKSHNYDVISYKFNQKMSWNLKIIMLFHANSTKYVMKSQNQDIIPYKFYQKHHEISKSWCYSLKILRRTPWNLTIMTLFHTNSTKNVKKSQNQDIIPYKFYQKCHEVTQLWRYSIQIQPKNVMKSQNHNIIPFKFFQKCHGFSKSWHYSIQNLPKMSRYLKNMTLFHTNSTKTS